MTTIACDHPGLFWSPYTWRRTGAGAAARAEAGMPGAYLRTTVAGTATIDLLLDGAANRGCPEASLPLIDYAIDDAPFATARAVAADGVAPLRLADGLDHGVAHRVEVHLRAAGLGPDRWAASTTHLRLAGLLLDAGATAAAPQTRPLRAIAFGDSITEGVSVDGSGPYYADLRHNNARHAWFPLACAGLGCEYGQLGTGGQGMVTRTMQIPPLPETWHRHAPDASRLVDGRLDPPPDLVFCAMGTNDYARDGEAVRHLDIAGSYRTWLEDVRRACPSARIACLIPPLGWHDAEIRAAVDARRRRGDGRVHLVDTAPLRDGFHEREPRRLAPDGVHPSLLGNAMLAALVVARVQQAMREPAAVAERG